MANTATPLRSSQADQLIFIYISPHMLVISQKITKVYLPTKVADVVTDDQDRRRRVENEEKSNDRAMQCPRSEELYCPTSGIWRGMRGVGSYIAAGTE
jgi:hypothetical protein